MFPKVPKRRRLKGGILEQGTYLSIILKSTTATALLITSLVVGVGAGVVYVLTSDEETIDNPMIGLDDPNLFPLRERLNVVLEEDSSLELSLEEEDADVPEDLELLADVAVIDSDVENEKVEFDELSDEEFEALIVAEDFAAELEELEVEPNEEEMKKISLDLLKVTLRSMSMRWSKAARKPIKTPIQRRLMDDLFVEDFESLRLAFEDGVLDEWIEEDGVREKLQKYFLKIGKNVVKSLQLYFRDSQNTDDNGDSAFRIRRAYVVFLAVEFGVDVSDIMKIPLLEDSRYEFFSVTEREMDERLVTLHGVLSGGDELNDILASWDWIPSRFFELNEDDRFRITRGYVDGIRGMMDEFPGKKSQLKFVGTRFLNFASSGLHGAGLPMLRDMLER
jgi:hypothetical protein